MPTKTISYLKRKVGVADVHGRKHLFIDGEFIPTQQDKKGGPYISNHLPYQSFANLHDLGKAIVDYRALDEKKKPSKRH